MISSLGISSTANATARSITGAVPTKINEIFDNSSSPTTINKIGSTVIGGISEKAEQMAAPAR